MKSALSAEFADRTALVTGGAQGIGRAVCQRLAEGGARVAVNYRTREAEALATVAAIREAGGVAIAVQADVTDEDEVAAMRESIENQLGPIELLVNNAGWFATSDSSSDAIDLWEAVLRENLRTTFVATWGLKDSMLARGFGRIVNIASTAALRIPAHAIAYGVAKAGVVALTQGWAQIWGGENIRVNCVAPGFINTAANLAMDPALVARIQRETPLGRGGEPDEAAAAITFLLSEASSFVNGQTLAVCGGRVMIP